jgi:hypothetical protein
MNENLYKVLKVGRKIAERILPPGKPLYKGAQYNSQQANQMIREAIIGPDPAMICRFGSTELNCLATYQNLNLHPGDYIAYLKQEIDFLSWDKPNLHTMRYVSGFFPINLEMLEKFAHLMIDDMKQVDILGSWCKQERFFEKELENAKIVNLPDLEPYYHKDPWSAELKNKKVLLIHPFVDSIRRQYGKRELLFKDKCVLPEFELLTYKSIESLAECETKFKSWFDALNFMKDGIGQMEFDVAIIGCGAYGFPLAAHVKRMGKKAIHLGGATQILFGIKGKRWEAMPNVVALMTEHWARPLPSEVPKGSEKVEGGAYW